VETALPLILFIIFIALAFDFINGFHDAANAIATVVATRVLSPFMAVLWSAFFNTAAIFIMGTGVAKTVGSGLIDLQFVTLPVILAGLLGAITWNLLTWWWKIPSSSSHTLLGGYAGAAMANAAMTVGLSAAPTALIAGGWIPTLIFIIAAPLIGLFISCVLMVGTSWLFQRANGPMMDKAFRGLQLVSSAFMSLAHGGNDAQKTAGIITGVLFTAGTIKSFDVPGWVLALAYLSMGLGTMAGGWRIVKTMSRRLTHLKPQGGFCAETAAAASILIATHLKLPISTTHVVTGAITGVGAVVRLKAVRWSVAGRILWTWALTLPASAALGAGTFLLVRLVLHPA
jgi:PiT family inorganic phosphate transporter